MKPYNYRQFLRELRKLCAKHGIELVVNSGSGGSHQSLVFKDPENDRSVNATIAKHTEVSPGVQRGILKAIARYAVHEAVADLAEVVRQILEDLFNGNF